MLEFNLRCLTMHENLDSYGVVQLKYSGLDSIGRS